MHAAEGEGRRTFAKSARPVLSETETRAFLDSAAMMICQRGTLCAAENGLCHATNVDGSPVLAILLVLILALPLRYCILRHLICILDNCNITGNYLLTLSFCDAELVIQPVVQGRACNLPPDSVKGTDARGRVMQNYQIA